MSVSPVRPWRDISTCSADGDENFPQDARHRPPMSKGCLQKDGLNRQSHGFHFELEAQYLHFDDQHHQTEGKEVDAIPPGELGFIASL